MSRPALQNIVSAVEAWDAEMNSNFGIFSNGPWPVYQDDNAGAGWANLAAFAAAFPASSYDRCIAFVKINGVTTPWQMFWSDGTSWNPVNGQNHGASIYLSADFAVATATLTVVPIDTVESDPDSLYDSTNKAIKVKTAGVYLIEAQITFAADAGGTYREAHLIASGAEVRKQIVSPNGTNAQGFTLVKRQVMAANDEVQIKVKHDKGSNLNVIGSGTDVAMRCSVSVQKVDQAG